MIDVPCEGSWNVTSERFNEETQELSAIVCSHWSHVSRFLNNIVNILYLQYMLVQTESGGESISSKFLVDGYGSEVYEYPISGRKWPLLC